MRIGIFFNVFECFAILRDQLAQKAEHIAFHIGIGVFIHRKAAGRMLYEQEKNTFARVGNQPFDFAGDLDHFFTRRCCHGNCLHLAVSRFC